MILNVHHRFPMNTDEYSFSFNFSIKYDKLFGCFAVRDDREQVEDKALEEEEVRVPLKSVGPGEL